MCCRADKDVDPTSWFVFEERCEQLIQWGDKGTSVLLHQNNVSFYNKMGKGLFQEECLDCNQIWVDWSGNLGGHWLASWLLVGWRIDFLGPGAKIGSVISVHDLISTFDLCDVMLSDTLQWDPAFCGWSTTEVSFISLTQPCLRWNISKDFPESLK